MARYLCLLTLFLVFSGSGLAALAQADDRVFGLEGQPNFRDIGGYETKDGRTIKTGLIYRSGELPRLSDADVAKLKTLGVKTVVNFLTPDEIAYRGEDRLPDGVRTISIPITGEIGGIPDAAGAIVEARKSGDFRKFPPSFNPQIHRDLVNGVADTQYRELFEVLADRSNYPLVYHCSHGVHRTGTATALLLSALNVPWETVRDDYLLSNDTRRSKIATRIDELETLASAQGMPDTDRAANSDAIRAFYILEPHYIDASRDRAVKKYGTLDRYLAERLGLSGNRKAALRDLLTAPADSAD
ncbi:MAG: tyrosine-protein phosphatase, partial [Pseudomonadota bacterium]